MNTEDKRKPQINLLGFKMVSPNTEDVYSLIGFVLTYIQTVEKNISFITTFVLQDGDELTIARLNSIEKNERKKALGYFIGKLKLRSDLNPLFEELLSDFLKNRNDFIHNQDKIEGWDLDSEKGVSNAKKFTVKLWRQANMINEILVALMLQWQKQTGINPPIVKKHQTVIEEINEKYGKFIDLLFAEKT